MHQSRDGIIVAMAGLENQVGYWNTSGVGKTFGHPVRLEWLDQLDRHARILDYGCGYGRVAGLLCQQGFDSVEGVDPAPNLIAQAHERWPTVSFSVIPEPPSLPYPDATIDAVLLFAVLTCVPTDAGQRELVAEIHRVLRPGALLYLSDLCLQEDERNRSCYELFAAKYGVYGIFETADGAVCRHHTMSWLRELLSEFDQVATSTVATETMNGHGAQALQLLAVKAR